MGKELELTDIPEDEVEQVVSDFRIEGATKITKERQPNGLWTVRASFTGPDYA